MSDSLAGRTESLTVRPLSQGEITEKQTPEDWVDWILSVDTHPDPFIQLDGAPVHEEVIAGGYPEALKRPTPRRAQRWFDSYTQRLSRHDAQELQAGDFPLYLDGLLRLLASQGQAELVKAKMARSLGISESTVRDYLELAETMFLTQSLPSRDVAYPEELFAARRWPCWTPAWPRP